jgi:hypothetical protein
LRDIDSVGYVISVSDFIHNRLVPYPDEYLWKEKQLWLADRYQLPNQW